MSHASQRFFSALAPRGSGPLTLVVAVAVEVNIPAHKKGAHSPRRSTLLYGVKGTKRVLEYARLAMGFADVRASRYGIR